MDRQRWPRHRQLPVRGRQGFWRWVDLCDKGGVDSIWQSDRLIGPDPNLECMSVMAALAGATRNLKFGMNVASLGLRGPGADRQGLRHH